MLRFSHWEKLSAELTDEGIGSELGTFSHWEKGYPGFGLKPSHHRLVQNLIHALCGTAEAGAFFCHNDGALDEDGVLVDGVE